METHNSLVVKIEQILDPLYPMDQPGAAVIVIKEGEVLFRKGYGMANLELGVKIEPHMVFRLGSITKQFTAVCILMLYEQGKLDLQDDLTRFLPEYPTGGRIITVEHLLTHTSGIKSYTSMPEWLPLWRKDMPVEELIDLFKEQPFDFEPGECFLYNNSGYILLGAIIEAISGMKYADFLQSYLFGPLGMTHTLYDDPVRIVKHRVAGYSLGKDGAINAPYLSMTQPYAAGSLASSVDDLATWEAALLANVLLKPETLELAFRPFILNNGESTGYGYGWGITSHAGMRFIEHGGGINGFATGGVRVPSEKIYVAVLTNSDAPRTDPSLLAVKLAALVSGHPMIDPTPIELPEDALQVYVGIYRVNDKEERIVTRQGNQLFFQRTGNKRFEIIPIASDAFFMRETADQFVFTRGDDKAITGIRVIRRASQAEYSLKTDKPLPGERQAIPLSVEALKRLTGAYELAPGYNIEIALTGDQLTIQPQGQEKLQLFAESTECLFAREVDLTVLFLSNEQGGVMGCTLTQGAQTFSLRKLK